MGRLASRTVHVPPVNNARVVALDYNLSGIMWRRLVNIWGSACSGRFEGPSRYYGTSRDQTRGSMPSRADKMPCEILLIYTGEQH